MNDINFRVYRRTYEQLIFLWDRRNVPEDSQINIYVREDDGFRLVEFIFAPEEIFGGEKKIPDSTHMAGLYHKKNNLNPYEDYSFRLTVSSEGKDSHYDILVLKVGVLPDTEKDKKEAHSQTFLWDYEGKLWVKAPLMKTQHEGKEIYAVPVVIVGDN